LAGDVEPKANYIPDEFVEVAGALVEGAFVIVMAGLMAGAALVAMEELVSVIVVVVVVVDIEFVSAAGAFVEVSVMVVPVSPLRLQPVRTNGSARTERRRGVSLRSDFMGSMTFCLGGY
jgi:hypothetical protein